MRNGENLGIILQARMGSTRLPGKIFMPIGEVPLLLAISKRVQTLNLPATYVIATTDLLADDAVEEFCKQQRISCFRGSQNNVLERYYRCAEKYNFTEIVRMTGDNPFPDIEALERLIVFHRAGGYDYSECFSVLPVGVGMEVFSFQALERSYRESSRPHHFEHVDEYILENPGLFHCGTLPGEPSTNFPLLRATVDTPQDYWRANWIAKELGGTLQVRTAALAALLSERNECCG